MHQDKGNPDRDKDGIGLFQPILANRNSRQRQENTLKVIFIKK